VEICRDPVLGGVDQALDWGRIDELIDMYPSVQIFLLLVDRDGRAGRRESLNALENRGGEKLGARRTLIGENAWQEVAFRSAKAALLSPSERRHVATSSA
jgi:hypothetical protein